MATTTPNYGWPVPTSTDFVKDGATAIEALGDAIDATVFGLPSGGLTLVTTVALSSTSTTVTNCFTSTYTNYLIVVNGDNTAATPTDLDLQMRASGVTTTTGYIRSAIRNTNTAGPTRDYSTGSSFIVGFVGNETSGTFVNIFDPQQSKRTSLTAMSSGWGSGGSKHGSLWGLLNNTTQYDSLVITSATTLTGNLFVYGYQD